jgi:hypothetical protein
MNFFTASLLFFASAIIAAPSRFTGPDPSKVYLDSISYGGTGCPQGSVGKSVAEDRQSFTLIFDSFVASSGPSVPITEGRKNCQLNINLRFPQGFSYTVAQFDYRGYVQLPAGVSAEQKSTYYFQGQTTQASGLSRWDGPKVLDYRVSDRLEAAAMVWCPCGFVLPININSQVRLLNANGQAAQITTDSIDGKVTHKYGLQWASC